MTGIFRISSIYFTSIHCSSC